MCVLFRFMVHTRYESPLPGTRLREQYWVSHLSTLLLQPTTQRLTACAHMCLRQSAILCVCVHLCWYVYILAHRHPQTIIRSK